MAKDTTSGKSTQEEFQRHESLGKCKAKPQGDTTWLLKWLKYFYKEK